MESPFAYRLKAARLQQGITQETLAKAVGISKQAISQYEHGKKKPDSTTLIALAKYFEKSTSYFLRPIITPLDKVEFRKKASLKGKRLEAIKVSILERLEPYLELESILGIQSHLSNPLRNLPVNQFHDVESAAETLRLHWHLGDNPIPNLLEMMEDHGIKIVEIALDHDFDGLSTWIKENIPVIILNASMDLLSKRFTSIHELGHLLLEFPSKTEQKFIEQACNRFAGAMLLPASILYEEIGKRRTRISYSELIPVKEYYGISLTAIMYRGKDLGIFPDHLIRRFWQQRNQDADLRHERGYGTYQGEEHATRFDQLLSKALTEEFISFSKAASLSGKELNFLKNTHRLI